MNLTDEEIHRLKAQECERKRRIALNAIFVSREFHYDEMLKAYRDVGLRHFSEAV